MVEIIWFNQNIPRHSFIGWLAVQNKLPTRDRMLCWGPIGDSNCVFCRNVLESRDNLFFYCFFTKRIWVSVMRLCLVSNWLFSWEDLIEWGFSNLKGKGMRSNICRLGLWATVYHIWLQRNAIIHRGHIKVDKNYYNFFHKVDQQKWGCGKTLELDTYYQEICYLKKYNLYD